MHHSESKFLMDITDEYNSRVTLGESSDLHLIACELAKSAWTSPIRDLKMSNNSQLADLRKQGQLAQSSVTLAMGEALRTLEAAIAQAAHLNIVMHSLMATWAESNELTSIELAGGKAVTGVGAEFLYHIGLHAQACTTVAEIRTLILHGLSDGARARCRTLHEVAILAAFMASAMRQSGELATRIHFASSLQYYKIFRRYARDAESFGEPDPDVEKLRRYEGYRIDVLAKFPKLDQGDYEWARPEFPSFKPTRRITFRDLEEQVGMEFFRHRYMQWSDAVHSSAYGIVSRANFGGGFTYRGTPELATPSQWHDLAIAFNYLLLTSEIVFRRLCWRAERYDDFCKISPLQNLCEEFSMMFSRVDASHKS